MRFIRLLLTLSVITIVLYLMITRLHVSDYIDDLQVQSEKGLTEIKKQVTKKQEKPYFEMDLYELLGKPADEVLEQFAKPTRKDMTPYGYTWWIYTDEETYQLQIGIEDEVVETIYLIGDGINSEPFTIGRSYDDLDEQFEFTREIVFDKALSMYRFKLTEEQVQSNPLIKIDDNVFIQSYFDTFTNELSSLRLIAGDKLLEQRPYELEYRGSLPHEREITAEDWQKIERAMEKQIVSLTNIYRNRFQLSQLQLDEQVSNVAYHHSKDMYEHDYFSHTSWNGNGLQERLKGQGIIYKAAGENIAAKYVDAPAAMEGWLNSEGHRRSLLDESFTHLGVGVYQLFYTQNFLQK